MKNKIKKLIPSIIKKYIVKRKHNIILANFFKKTYAKKALLSYIVHPFIRGVKQTHTNNIEAYIWAKLLNEFEYQVDIIQYNNELNLDLTQYDLICGFGNAFEQYIYTKNVKAKTIFYATGMNNCWQNYITLKRLRDVFNKKGVWIGNSIRYIDKCYTAHVSYVDSVIALGNDICKKSYIKYNPNIFQLDAPFFKIFDYKEIVKNKEKDFNKHFLWFGGFGAVHKGLDLLLNFFSKRDDIFLHVCGDIEKEQSFFEVYKKELLYTKNILYYGFLDISSKNFYNILRQCAFTIFPSASEGGSPSLLTTIGNGGLIPVITKETTIDTGYEIWIDGFEEYHIKDAIEKALFLKKYEIKKMMYKNAEIVNEKNSIDKYKKNLKRIIEEII
jgi:hypothetical protein